MGKPLRDLSGQKFGALVAISMGPKLRPTSGAWWLCRCECGSEKSIPSSDLVAGKVRSCGCLHGALKSESLRTHGLTKTRTHRIWQAMLTRCRNPRAPNFQHYGGRGIKVCERWLEFENFYADMGECPENFSIDRIDVNGDYAPENCRWASRKEQANNTRSNVFFEFNGERLTRTQWEEKLGMGKTTLRNRLRSGVSVADALTKEVARV